MRSCLVIVLAVVLTGALTSSEAIARQRGNPERGAAVRVPAPPRGSARDPVVVRDGDMVWLGWPVARVESRGRNGEGPAFCRSRQGHPVHGRRWCLDRGFGLGGGRWVRVGWDDIVFRQPRRREPLRQRDLTDLLGDIIVSRFVSQASYLGLGGPLTGAWVEEPNGPAVLRIMVAGIPIAELVDANRTGRASTVLLDLGR